jgi:hypothetical protein
MTDNRKIASDATFFVLYIGFTGAMFALSIALLLWSMYDSFTATHSYAAIFNLAGWIVLPFFPALYRSYTGRGFRVTSGDSMIAA